MASTATFGVSKRGKRTLIYINYEYWQYRTNNKDQTLWRCNKREVFKCKATLKTADNAVIANGSPEHNHSGNVATALARTAIAKMKEHMTENIATPSASQGAVVVKLDGHVQMALPKRASLSRVLRRHRQIKSMAANNGAALPSIPSDKTFQIPDMWQEFLL